MINPYQQILFELENGWWANPLRFIIKWVIVGFIIKFILWI